MFLQESLRTMQQLCVLSSPSRGGCACFGCVRVGCAWSRKDTSISNADWAHRDQHCPCLNAAIWSSKITSAFKLELFTWPSCQICFSTATSCFRSHSRPVRRKDIWQTSFAHILSWFFKVIFFLISRCPKLAFMCMASLSHVAEDTLPREQPWAHVSVTSFAGKK